MNDKLLIVFTRNQIAGRVKSRIASVYGNEKALLLNGTLMHKTLETASRVDADKSVSFSDFIDDTIFSGLTNDCSVQKGNDLGERMYNSFLPAFNIGYRQIILIGTDIPDLTPEIIKQGFSLLNDHDCVIGPAGDGGYYLIGLRVLDQQVFSGISWGTSEVLSQTIDRLRKHGFSFSLLPVLCDIDNKEDAMRYPELKDLLLRDP